jgi:acyl-CoA dehydrogenase
MQPGELRDRLTEGVYIPDDNSEPVAQLDDALLKAVKAEPALRKLRDAMRTGMLAHGDPETMIDPGLRAGVINEVEANGIRAAITARKLVIQVDAFDSDFFTKEQKAWGHSNLGGVAGRSM